MNDAYPKLTPITSGGKIEQVLSALQNLIIDENLQPGTELPSERELSEQLQVSRFSIREALRVAQAQGLIEIRRGKKPTVSNPSAAAAARVIGLTLRRSQKTFLDLIIARQVLECQIVRYAAQLATKKDIEVMEETIDAMSKNKKNLELCTEKDIEFHNLLLKASGNVVFEIMIAPVSELLRKSRSITLEYRGVDIAIEAHTKILAAVSNHDPQAAYDAMGKHLSVTEETIKEIEKQSL